MVLVSLAPHPARAQEKLWGRTVTSIKFESDSNLQAGDFARQITQKPGDPLDPGRVSESLKNLYATGLFRTLSAEAEPREGGVDLVFVARAQVFVGVVRVEGAPPALEAAGLAAATRLRLGDPLTDQDLEATKLRLLEVLAENGYHRARADARVETDRDTLETSLVFSVHPGEPATLWRVEFLGHPGFPAGRLLGVTGWKPGHRLSSVKFEQGLFRLHQFYSKRGWLQATTNLRKREYDTKRNTESLAVEIEAGPRIRVRVSGADLPGSKLREAIPIFRDGVTDDFALRQGEENLQNYFEREGDYDVKVTSRRETRAQPPEIDVTFEIDPGAPGVFEGYAFKGNRAISTETLTEALTIEPRSFFRDPGTFSRRMLAHDAASLAVIYQSRGYLEAKIVPKLETDHGGKVNRLFVTFEIEEGEATTVARTTFDGPNSDFEKQLWGVLLCRDGQPFSPARADADRISITGYLADRGYSRATVSWTSSPGEQAHRVNLVYRVQPGPQETVRRVVIMGNRYTRSGVIRRELAFRQGEPLNQSAVVDSQRRLYDLGIFNQVQIAPRDPQGQITEKTVLVNVEEARRWTLGYGGGFEVQRLGGNQPQGQYKASPRLSLELSRLNLGGRPQTFTLRGQLSNLERAASLTYFVPTFSTRRDLNLRLYGLADRSRDVLTFTAERIEATASVEKRYSPAAIVVGRYTFRHVLVDPSTLRIAPENIPLLSRPARIGMISASYINDHRDDPADATRGSYSLADAGGAWEGFGSQSDFLRLSAQNATYYRLARHLIFARNTRFAVESTFNHGGPAKQIPLPERFFMGGSESHRGFSINQAGPRDPVTGFPIGGNSLFINSLELRVPFSENRFGLVFFHDAGNVYSTIRRMKLLKVEQNSPTDLDYTVHAAGLGFRYKTPVGPLRFDVGYAFNPPKFQVAVPGGLEVRRLSRFEFFLGIGQSF